MRWSSKSRRNFGRTLVAVSALCSFFFCYTAKDLTKFSPVYTPIKCLPLVGEMGEMASWRQESDNDVVNLTVFSAKSCENSNGYSISVSQARTANGKEVYVRRGDASDLTLVGISVLPIMTIDAYDSSKWPTMWRLSMPVMTADELLAEDHVTLISKLSIVARAEINYLGYKIEIWEELDEVCGMEVRLSTRKMGNVGCATSMKDLVVPGIDDPTVAPSFYELSPERMEAETRRRNVTFGVALAVLFVVAAVTGISAGRLLRRQLTDVRARPRSNRTKWGSERSTDSQAAFAASRALSWTRSDGVLSSTENSIDGTKGEDIFSDSAQGEICDEWEPQQNQPAHDAAWVGADLEEGQMKQQL